MIEIIHLLREIGNSSLSAFWFPLLIWTALGLGLIVALKVSHRIHAVYQYHGRLALLFALPAGLLISNAISKLVGLFAPSQALTAKLIVVDNPITVTAVKTGSSIPWDEPALWIGCVTLVLALIAIGYLAKIAADFAALYQLSGSLKKVPLSRLPSVSDSNRALGRKTGGNPTVAFTDKTQVPFTFGWVRATIVIPRDMKDDTERVNMVLRHELMHIKHRDFLLNNLLLLIKSVFWFHPLVHRLYEDIKEYREISCDSEVLSDKNISKKGYAELLFELAPRKVYQNCRTVSMAVNPSTLKKRIQVMKNQNYSGRTFRASFTLALVSFLSFAGIIACSDMQSTGITKQDVVNMQSTIDERPSSVQPLYVINDVRVDLTETGDVISRIKPEYIKSIEVLKGKDATDAYGADGKNGVIKIQLLDEEKAFSDLLPAPPSASNKTPTDQEDHFVVVEEMPELVGGLKSIQKEIRYPQMARKGGIEGRVIVQFIVNEQGKVENPKIIRGIGGGCDQEALRVVKLAQFEPGMQRGKPVRVQYSLPVIFRLEDSDNQTTAESANRQSGDEKTSDNLTGASNTLPNLTVVGYGQSKNNSPGVAVSPPNVVSTTFLIKDFSNNGSGYVSGRLIDKNSGKPLPGANITVAGTRIGSSTDLDGEFAMYNVPAGDQEIRISYIGYKTKNLQLTIK